MCRRACKARLYGLRGPSGYGPGGPYGEADIQVRLTGESYYTGRLKADPTSDLKAAPTSDLKAAHRSRI